MHWHGFEIPHSMDGGPGISQDPILPGGRFVYEFTLHQAGAFLLSLAHGDAGNDGDAGRVHHASQNPGCSASRQGFRALAAGVCGSTEQHRTEHA